MPGRVRTIQLPTMPQQLPSDEVTRRSPREPNPAKVTARMLELRTLIAEGSYPDRDELAERIVETTLT
jgi:hypothetical protein